MPPRASKARGPKRPIKRKSARVQHGKRRFPERGGKDWRGPLVMYREIELLRKFLTSSNKVMSRKRSGANAREMAAMRTAIKRARFMALVPYIAG